jgi:hypothetical protein
LYVGTGPVAEQYARQEAERRQRRQVEFEARHAEAARVAPADRALRDFAIMADLLASATLLLAGYHQHHGSWRRRHDQTRQGRAT